MSALTVRQVRWRYLVLHSLRWFPVGLLIPVTVLLMRERGLSLAQIGLVVAVQGLVVLALELPTAGLVDALGSKPVLLVGSAASLASLALLVVADTFALLVAVWVLQGIFRALDSGPLESWYVNASLAADPEIEYERGLAAGGTVLGLAIATGALLSGGLVALGPVDLPGAVGPLERLDPVSALTLPVLVATALQVLYLIALGVLLAEARPARGVAGLRASLADAPRMIGAALGLLRRSRILLALVAVEFCWGFGMVAFEGLLPIRLSEVVGDADRAAALLGPAASAAWLASAAGAAAVPWLARWLGSVPAAALLRLLQGATVAGMGLLAGPAGVLAAFLACYAVHGASSPLHQGLLHRQVDGGYRTSVISLNSMMAFAATAVGSIVLTALAGATTVTTAMLVGAGMLAVAAPCYLPAWLAARPAAAPEGGGPDGGGSGGGASGGGGSGDATGAPSATTATR